MQIVLVALLYASAISQPVATITGYVYDNIQECRIDAEKVKQALMLTAPSEEARVDVQCLVFPRSV